MIVEIWRGNFTLRCPTAESATNTMKREAIAHMHIFRRTLARILSPSLSGGIISPLITNPSIFVFARGNYEPEETVVGVSVISKAWFRRKTGVNVRYSYLTLLLPCPGSPHRTTIVASISWMILGVNSGNLWRALFYRREQKEKYRVRTNLNFKAGGPRITTSPTMAASTYLLELQQRRHKLILDLVDCLGFVSGSVEHELAAAYAERSVTHHSRLDAQEKQVGRVYGKILPKLLKRFHCLNRMVTQSGFLPRGLLCVDLFQLNDGEPNTLPRHASHHDCPLASRSVLRRKEEQHGNILVYPL